MTPKEFLELRKFPIYGYNAKQRSVIIIMLETYHRKLMSVNSVEEYISIIETLDSHSRNLNGFFEKETINTIINLTKDYHGYMSTSSTITYQEMNVPTLVEFIHNVMGVIDTPIGRRKFATPFHKELLSIGRLLIKSFKEKKEDLPF